MRRLSAAMAAAVLASIPAYAAAQDDEGEAPATGETATTEGQGEGQPRANISASGYATTEQPFEARRGFFTEGEFGVFFTIGGKNSNLPGLPSKGVSNANPYVTVTIGYDVVSSPNFALSIGPKLGAGFNGGASRVSNADVAAGLDGSTFANDYSVFEAGLTVNAAFMVAERLSITAKLNGGGAFVDPNPGVDANDPNAGDMAIGGLFGVSAGVEWYTLLNGFSVGLQARFQGILVEGFIPGIAIPATLKYTF